MQLNEGVLTSPCRWDAKRFVPLDIEDSVAYHIHRTARLLRRHFLNMAAQAGLDLTPEQWFCLNKLRIRGEQSQVELSDAIFSDGPNVTRILSGLERRGLIKRRRDEEDARRVLVSLTQKGRRQHDEFASVVEVERETLLADISDRETRQVRRVFEKLEARIKT